MILVLHDEGDERVHLVDGLGLAGVSVGLFTRIAGCCFVFFCQRTLLDLWA